MTETPAVAVLLSGEGSNFEAIADYAARTGAYRVVGVISDQAGAGGLGRAARLGVAAQVCARDPRMAREQHEGAIREALDRLAPDLVVLAGYMRILSAGLVEDFEGRMLNVHPSLLPKYRGLHTHRRALAAGDAQHGTSVHFVTAELDGGPVIAQATVPVTHADTEVSLQEKVQMEEYRLYPRVIDAVCRGDVTLEGGRARWHGRALDEALDVRTLEEAYQ